MSKVVLRDVIVIDRIMKYLERVMAVGVPGKGKEQPFLLMTTAFYPKKKSLPGSGRLIGNSRGGARVPLGNGVFTYRVLTTSRSVFTPLAVRTTRQYIPPDKLAGSTSRIRV